MILLPLWPGTRLRVVGGWVGVFETASCKRLFSYRGAMRAAPSGEMVLRCVV